MGYFCENLTFSGAKSFLGNVQDVSSYKGDVNFCVGCVILFVAELTPFTYSVIFETF